VLELEHAPAGARVLHDDVRADDVRRHQVGRELDAAELQAQGLRQRADQVGLAQPGHALQQRVPADEQAGQHPVDDLPVADDRLADLLAQPGELAAEFIGGLLHLRIDGVGHVLAP